MTSATPEPIPWLLDPEVEEDPASYYRGLRALGTIRFDESVGAYLPLCGCSLRCP